MERSEADNLDQYKSYIQRRRVVSEHPGTRFEDVTDDLKTEDADEVSVESHSDSYRDYISDGRDYPAKEVNSQSDKIFEFARNEKTSDRGSTVTALRRADPSLYQRLYGQNRRTSSASYYGRYGGAYSASGHGTEIEDNRTTVLAITIIKQALACFALLGVIVFLQHRNDTVDALSFIRKHVVETNIEPQSILNGAENIVKECWRFLGGSP